MFRTEHMGKNGKITDWFQMSEIQHRRTWAEASCIVITENHINKSVHTIKVIYLLLITRGLNLPCKKWICATKDSRNIKAKENGAGFGGGEVVINGTYIIHLVQNKSFQKHFEINSLIQEVWCKDWNQHRAPSAGNNHLLELKYWTFLERTICLVA